MMAIALLAALAVSPDVVAQLKAMNDADCATSKTADWAAYERTLAPEYVSVNVDGSWDDRASTVTGLSEPSDDRVTACATAVSKVERDGDTYYLYGTYVEDGTRGAKHTAYRSVQLFRDAWKRSGGKWLQTQSIIYETTIKQHGKTARFVLPQPERECYFKTNSRVRVATLTVNRPQLVKSLPLQRIADVEIAQLPSGIRCGPRIVRTGGSLAIDDVAIQTAIDAYDAAIKANGANSVGTYLYRVRFISSSKP